MRFVVLCRDYNNIGCIGIASMKWTPHKDFWKHRGLPDPVSEYRFAPPRRWRFDFAWVDRMVAVEVEGGLWISGRHNRGAGMLGDMAKYNEATRLGWEVYRFSTQQMPLHETAEFLRSVYEFEKD